MKINTEIVNALRYFQQESSSDVQLIRIADEYVFSIHKLEAPSVIGSIPASDIQKFMDQWHGAKINVISYMNESGEYVLPDISELEANKILDY